MLAFLIIPLNIILLFIPDKYFSGKVYFFKQVGGGEEMVKKEDQGKTSIYSLFERTDAVHKSKKELEKEKSGSIWLSLFDGVFLFISLSRTVVMFIFMAIHYWLGDYFITVLEMDDKAKKTSSYSFISLVGPFAGSMLGGSVCQFFTGGYDKKSSIFVCLFFSLLTCISGTLVPEMKSFQSFVICLFCYFLFANGMMPILIGISFNCVPKTLRGSAYSVNSLLCTFLGNLPAPAVYGKLNDMFKAKDKRMAMRCVTNYIWVNFALLVLTAILRYRRKEEGDEKPTEQRSSRVSDVGVGMESSTGQNPISEMTTTTGKPKANDGEELKDIENN